MVGTEDAGVRVGGAGAVCGTGMREGEMEVVFGTREGGDNAGGKVGICVIFDGRMGAGIVE